MANPMLGDYAATWVAQRKISTRARDHYQRLLTARLLPEFANTSLGDISSVAVRDWYIAAAGGPTTVRTHAYALLRSIMQAAVAEGLIETNPCQIPGVTTSHQATRVRTATLAEVEAIAEAMPRAYQPLILMAAWLAMPFSELTELRRKDIDLVDQVVRVRRAVTLVNGVFKVSTPKSKEGIRDIAIPPSLRPPIAAHLRLHVQPGREALLFPSVQNYDRHLGPSVLSSMFRRARQAAGRPDLPVADLRRSGAAWTQRQRQRQASSSAGGGGGPL